VKKITDILGLIDNERRLGLREAQLENPSDIFLGLAQPEAVTEVLAA